MSAGAQAPVLRHGSCVACGDRAVLVIGPSGSGKSSLTLALIAMGAELVSDDQVLLTPRDGGVFASAPAAISGLLEVRRTGILRMNAVSDRRLWLVVDLDLEVEARLPHARHIYITDACFPLIGGKNHQNLNYLVMACLRSGLDPILLDPES